jgi:uncharacterized protein YoxC
MLDYGRLTVDPANTMLQILGLLLTLFVLAAVVFLINIHKKYMNKLNEIDSKISAIDKKITDK